MTSEVTPAPRSYDEVIRKTTPQKPRTPIEIWLAARDLSEYAPALADMGVKRVSDLVFLTDDDMKVLKVDPSSRLHFHVRVVG